MVSRTELKSRVCAEIDRSRESIVSVGETIMDAPELGFKEFSTADRVRETFDELGVQFQDGLAITGVKGILRGAKPGPTICLMGELDALQVPDHPRADPQTGAAHACGHNAQVAGLMGAAMGLVRSGVADQLAGNVVFFCSSSRRVRGDRLPDWTGQASRDFISDGQAGVDSAGAF